jgi:hypothetical protein
MQNHRSNTFGSIHNILGQKDYITTEYNNIKHKIGQI